MKLMKKPQWFKLKLNHKSNSTSKTLKKSNLNTVCEEAKCPNRNECFSNNTATFLILGNICTRNCKYCAVISGTPLPVVDETVKILEAIETLNLNYVVVTSVTRDDLPDGGASVYANLVTQVKAQGKEIEVLIPDFQLNMKAIQTVVNARPDVLNHNIEACKSVFIKVRPQGSYKNSLDLLKYAKDIDDTIVTKSGLMVGLGEQFTDVIKTLNDLRNAKVDIVTIGQYLQPSSKHHPVNRYVSLEEFNKYEQIGKQLGFKSIISSPLVRSSYQAQKLLHVD